MKINYYYQNLPVLCVKLAIDVIPLHVYPIIGEVYTIRDVVLGHHGKVIGFLLNEIENTPASAYTGNNEIYFPRDNFLILTRSGLKEADINIEQQLLGLGITSSNNMI